jgi:hypothetical protein
MPSLKSFYIEWKFKGKTNRFFMALGGLFLAAALIGVAIPIIPQVPFAIIAAYFFSKGSFRIHTWMRYNKYFGKPVRDWEDFRIIRPKMKVISIISLIVGAIFSHMKLDPAWAYLIDVVFALSIAFILTRRSRILSFLS